MQVEPVGEESVGVRHAHPERPQITINSMRELSDHASGLASWYTAPRASRRSPTQHAASTSDQGQLRTRMAGRPSSRSSNAGQDDAIVAVLGGNRQFVECKVAPRWGALTREVLAINMVMAGCRPEYAAVVRTAMLALTDRAFNLNGVQATTHVASPLIVVNGPIAEEIGMNGAANAFGSGNRANATVGRAVRLIMLNVGGGWPPDFDKSTLGHPGEYTYCVTENEADSPFAPYHVEHGYKFYHSTVFAIAAEAPHSVTDHQCNDPEGILDTMCSAMSTIASNSALLGGHCTVVLDLEHAKTIAKAGWTRSDIRHYLWMNSGNPFRAISRDHRYGKVYNEISEMANARSG